MSNARLLPAAALLFAACATSTPPPSPRPAPAPTLPSDAEQFRTTLEETWQIIAARENRVVTPPTVDFEAAASIPIPEHRSIQSALELFTKGLRDSIQTSLHRSAKYRKMIDRALDEEDLPRGLAYLPVIESAYTLALTSRAGAHGMWQFMPDTAREYGLRVDWWIDERADPEKSTRAAASYLKDLYRQFEDWPLALAAYNCGPGRVRRTLASTGATSFWQLLERSALPRETRGYVPTFFATLLIASDPQAHGFTLDAAIQPAEDSVDVDGPVTLGYLADVAGVAETTLREMNPSLRRGVVPPGGARVRMPAAAVRQVAARAASLKNEDPDVAFCSFTVRKGDTIAKLARALDAPADTIAAMNGLSSKAELRTGRSIYLPVRARELGALLRHGGDRAVFYTVRKGDTIYSIAQRHQLTVAELRELNSLERDATIHPGRKLRVSPARGVTAGGM
ncbi:MAG TPA: transglycosylase SLT domain-containing protein [Thermoanaerobaculia bacterium]|nr:transglycosylase SLT domain-containing protein [Thermoanaerobaculia bacterium]